eukprot:gene19701-26393_t
MASLYGSLVSSPTVNINYKNQNTIYPPMTDAVSVLGPLFVPSAYARDLDRIELGSSGQVSIGLLDTFALNIRKKTVVQSPTVFEAVDNQPIEFSPGDSAKTFVAGDLIISGSGANTRDTTAFQSLMSLDRSTSSAVQKELSAFLYMSHTSLFTIGNVTYRFLVEVKKSLTNPVKGTDIVNTIARRHENVTIMFADVVGFTKACTEMEPEQVMSFLNVLFKSFDDLLHIHNVFKLETVGDCYVAVAGIFDEANGTPGEGNPANVTVCQAFEYAKKIMCVAWKINMPTANKPVDIKIGLHSGAVTSGIIDPRRPRFCFTMNTASRMESTSLPGHIQVSEEVYSLLSQENKSDFKQQTINAKGKGKMCTYIMDCKELPLSHGFGTNSPVLNIDLANPKITFNLQTDTDVVLQRTTDAKPAFKTHNDRFYLETGVTDGQRVALATSDSSTTLTSSTPRYNLSSQSTSSSLDVRLASVEDANGTTVNKTTLASVGSGSNKTELQAHASSVSIVAPDGAQFKTAHVEVQDPSATTRKVALKHDLVSDKLVINSENDYAYGVALPSALAIQSTAFTVSDSRSVGFGTDSPVSKLHVSLPSEVETHDVQKFALTAASLVDLKSAAISFSDPTVTATRQAFKHDVQVNALMINDLLDFDSINFGTNNLVIDNVGNSRFNSTALTIVGDRVGVATATPDYALDVATDARVAGNLYASSIVADEGKDLYFKSPNSITLDAKEINMKGTINVVNKSEVDIEDYLLVLAKQSEGANSTDVAIDGSGIKLDHRFQNLPSSVDPASVEQSFR